MTERNYYKRKWSTETCCRGCFPWHGVAVWS